MEAELHEMRRQGPVKGIEGYAASTQRFIDATMALSFHDLHSEFIPFIPVSPSRILDAGAGIGRDAWEFSQMGHSVTAAEPTKEYRVAGKKLFELAAINWIDDALPDLKMLGEQPSFDFILASGVFHHLDTIEQEAALYRMADLLKSNGIFALSLRSGPGGVGTCVFPTSSDITVHHAEAYGLKLLLRKEKLPSLMSGKPNVTWSKLVFQKK